MKPSARKVKTTLLVATPILLLSAYVALGGIGGEPPPKGFTILLDDAPKDLDPRFASSDTSAKLGKLVFSALVTVDTQSGEPELDLASSIDVANPTTINITLRKDALWHDGKPVTAEDVEYTFTQLDAVGSAYAGLSRRIDKFIVHDPHSLTIHLKEPHAPFINDLVLGIVPKHKMGAKGLFPPGELIGSGPFRYTGRKGDAWMAMEPFKDYYHGAPTLERLVFRTIRDDNARLLALMGGSGQMFQNAINPLMLPAVKDYPELVTESSPSFKYTYLAFNLSHPILKDLKVRKAIAYAIDRDAIIEHKFAGLARKSTGLLPPPHWAYNGNVTTYAHNQDKARALLDEAGYPDPDGDGPGTRMTLVYKTTTNQFRRSIAALISMQLAEIGIDLKVQAYEWGTFFGDIKSRNFEMCSLQWTSVIEPHLYSWIFHSTSIPTPEKRSSGGNRGGYINLEVDTLLDKARIEMNREARAGLYHKVQAILADELPYVSLWHEDNIVVRNARVQGYQPVPNARFVGLTKTRLQPRK